MLSALITVPPSASASASASADLPLAVGPATSSTASGGSAMALLSTGAGNARNSRLAFGIMVADIPPMSESVLTLIAARAPAAGWSAVLARAAEALRGLGADLGATRWLAPERAVDLGFAGLDPEQAEAAARQALARAPGAEGIDLVAQ